MGIVFRHYSEGSHIEVPIKNNGALLGRAKIFPHGEIHVRFNDPSIPKSIIELFEMGLADSLEIRANVIPAQPRSLPVFQTQPETKET